MAGTEAGTGWYGSSAPAKVSEGGIPDDIAPSRPGTGGCARARLFGTFPMRSLQAGPVWRNRPAVAIAYLAFAAALQSPLPGAEPPLGGNASAPDPPLPADPAPVSYNEAVLTINTDRISRAEVERHMGLKFEALRKEREILIEQKRFDGVARARYEREYGEEFLQRLRDIVMEKLLLQWAREERFRVAPEDVDREIEGRVRRDGGIRKTLEKAGGSMADLRREIEEMLLINMAAERIRIAAGRPSRREVAEYYETHKREFVRPAAWKVRRIVVGKTIPDPETGAIRFREGALALAEEIAVRARGGEDFGDLARRYSDDRETRERGGLIAGKGGDPFVEPERLGGVAVALAGLPIGGVSDAINLGHAWGVFKVEGRREAGIAPLDEVYNEIYEMLRAKKIEEANRTWLRGRLARSLLLDSSGKRVRAEWLFPGMDSMGEATPARSGPAGGAGR
ncbi:MAG: peptidyl-prolyl cis-trans isomerase [Planctomycetota bacterium]|nr:peptidyl-prolyl cis-trans isomerase [Planctomycetota bacterium]